MYSSSCIWLYPFERGTFGQSADTRGSTAAIFNFIAGLNSTADSNSYEGINALGSLEKVNINRDPEHHQVFEFTMLELNHDISDELQLVVKELIQQEIIITWVITIIMLL